MLLINKNYEYQWTKRKPDNVKLFSFHIQTHFARPSVIVTAGRFYRSSVNVENPSFFLCYFSKSGQFFNEPPLWLLDVSRLKQLWFITKMTVFGETKLLSKFIHSSRAILIVLYTIVALVSVQWVGCMQITTVCKIKITLDYSTTCEM